MNAKEIKVEKGVFCLLFSKTLTDDMRHSLNAIFILDCGGDSHSAGATQYHASA